MMIFGCPDCAHAEETRAQQMSTKAKTNFLKYLARGSRINKTRRYRTQNRKSDSAIIFVLLLFWFFSEVRQESRRDITQEVWISFEENGLSPSAFASAMAGQC
jgi:hypothetical protein